MRRAAERFVVEDGQLVLIAFHLHKRCFSVRLATTRKVAGYTDRIIVRDVRFPVSSSGRMRVLRERKKNVHAFVKGKYEQDIDSLSQLQLREAYYNPYQVTGFVDRETAEPLNYADIAVCEGGKVYYWRANR
ncbi:hypothetical protein OIN60_05790 [Paenibacillus sp. P96]|uniref:Uncharacterized protein n=1 Tax=Paenibacillus zeirhizosphaerae TaxID=2987519 RepID=A0ABT9FP49_9BACL|nr:hypothetical protein [Paenibacillus sp. P96]MDP4096281.1 hypothetical protein [Paenibacillus sp. P96]